MNQFSSQELDSSDTVKEAFDNDLIVEMPTVISELIVFYLVDELTLGLWDNPGKQSKALTSIGGREKSRKKDELEH